MSRRRTPVSLHATLSGLAIVVVAGACGTTDERPMEDLVRSGGVYLEPETMTPYSGVAFATVEGRPGGIAQRLSGLEGSYDGPFEAVFEDHRFSSKEAYENGVRNGRYEWFFESGALFEEGTYVDGRLHGPYRAYWEDGDPYEEGTYREGRFHGPRRWYLGGRLVELVTYRDGIMDGLYERYRDDGTLDLKGMLRDGNPCGTWIENDHSVSHAPCSTPATD